MISQVSRSEHLVQGLIERTLAIRIRGPEIAERFPKIPKKRRDELASLDAPLDVQLMVYAVMESCERVYCVLLEAVRAEVLAAIERIEAVHAEAQSFDPTAMAAFIDGTTFSGPQVRQLPMDFIRMDLVPIAKQALRDSARLAAAPPTRWTAAMLA